MGRRRAAISHAVTAAIATAPSPRARISGQPNPWASARTARGAPDRPTWSAGLAEGIVTASCLSSSAANTDPWPCAAAWYIPAAGRVTATTRPRFPVSVGASESGLPPGAATETRTWMELRSTTRTAVATSGGTVSGTPEAPSTGISAPPSGTPAASDARDRALRIMSSGVAASTR